MEIISLERILPEDLVRNIRDHVEKWTNDEDYTLLLGRVIVNAQIINKEQIFKIIVTSICDYYSVPQAIVLSRIRKKPYVVYRQMIVYFLDRYYNINQKEIANMVGFKERSTVSYSIITIKNLIDTDKRMAFDINNINLMVSTAVGPA
jgi:chromosomal replication initiator protein